MNLKNKNTGDQYFIDLFEKWWHYPLLGLTWFLPHKAYKISVNINNNSKKFKFSTGMALAMAFGFIINRMLEKINFIEVSPNYYWIGRVFAYPICTLLMFTFWKYIKKLVTKGNRVDFGKAYFIKIKFYSLNTVRKCIFRFSISVISIFLLATSIEYNLYGMLISMLLSFVMLFSTTLIIGSEVEIISAEGDNLITE